MPANLAAISQFLSVVLRHQPDAIGLTLGPIGWVSVNELRASNDNQRFALDKAQRLIRAAVPCRRRKWPSA